MESVPDDSRVSRTVQAASASLGRPLTDPVSFAGGSDRSLVLRCHDPAGGTVVVKSYFPVAGAAGAFEIEAAGLAVAADSGLSPVLLAADVATQTIVMSDLGDGGSMADVLLGQSAPAARSALLDWAEACGRLSVAAAGREAEFADLADGYREGRAEDSYATRLPDRILAAGDRAVQNLGVELPAGLAAELAEVATVARPGRAAVFSPGDICPDNNLLTAAGVRFLDFESAGYHSAFLDAAYIRMPFSTCWCVFRLPAELSLAAEQAYRRGVAQLWPELADDAVWQPGVRRAVAAWTLSSMSWLLGSAIEADEPMDADKESPHTRQLMRYRWQVLGSELDAAGDLPALASLCRTLLAATEHWQVQELPLYPAFR